eukprot:1004610_1
MRRTYNTPPQTTQSNQQHQVLLLLLRALNAIRRFGFCWLRSALFPPAAVQTDAEHDDQNTCTAKDGPNPPGEPMAFGRRRFCLEDHGLLHELVSQTDDLI